MRVWKNSWALCAFLLLSSFSPLWAAGEKCQAKRQEIENIQNELRSLKSPSGKSFADLQRQHDVQMAKLVMLKGLEKMSERYNQFLEDVFKTQDQFDDISELSSFQNDLKKGIDVMDRMMVMEDLVDSVLKTRDKEGVEEAIEKNGLYNTLKDQCDSSEVESNKLCQTLNGEDQNSAKIQRMVKGFAKAYGLVAKEGYLNQDRLERFSPFNENGSFATRVAAEVEMKKRREGRLDYFLNDYQKLLNDEFNHIVDPDDIYSETQDLKGKIDQALVKSEDGQSANTFAEEVSSYQNQVKERLLNGFNRFLGEYQPLNKPLAESENAEKEEVEQLEEEIRANRETYGGGLQENEKEEISATLSDSMEGREKAAKDLNEKIEEGFNGLRGKFQNDLQDFLQVAPELSQKLDFHSQQNGKKNPLNSKKDFMNKMTKDLCSESSVIQSSEGSNVSFHSRSLKSCLNELNKDDRLANRKEAIEDDMKETEDEIQNLKENAEDYAALHDAFLLSMQQFSDQCMAKKDSTEAYHLNCKDLKIGPYSDKIQTLQAESGEIIAMLDNKLHPHRFKETQETVGRMKDLCDEGLAKDNPETCGEISQDHALLQAPSEEERELAKWREMHRNYYVSRDENGNLIREKRPSQSLMFFKALASGVQEHAVPAYMENQRMDSMMNYNTNWAMYNKYQQDLYETSRESFFIPMWQDQMAGGWGWNSWNYSGGYSGGSTGGGTGGSSGGGFIPASEFMFSESSQIYYNGSPNT